jgi:hypothetical protein
VFLLAPILFFIVAWFVDRRMRRHSALVRWLAFAGFSLFALGFFAAMMRVPPRWQFSGGSSTVVGLSYTFSLGWMTIPLIAGAGMVGVCCGIISVILLRRLAAERKT